MTSTQIDVKEYSYFADNQWRNAKDNVFFEVHQPYSGELFARVAAGSRADGAGRAPAAWMTSATCFWINSHSGQRQYPF